MDILCAQIKKQAKSLHNVLTLVLDKYVGGYTKRLCDKLEIVWSYIFEADLALNLGDHGVKIALRLLKERLGRSSSVQNLFSN